MANQRKQQNVHHTHQERSSLHSTRRGPTKAQLAEAGRQSGMVRRARRSSTHTTSAHAKHRKSSDTGTEDEGLIAKIKKSLPIR